LVAADREDPDAFPPYATPVPLSQTYESPMLNSEEPTKHVEVLP
jgi:hypothetical protein